MKELLQRVNFPQYPNSEAPNSHWCLPKPLPSVTAVRKPIHPFDIPHYRNDSLLLAMVLDEKCNLYPCFPGCLHFF